MNMSTSQKNTPPDIMTLVAEAEKLVPQGRFDEAATLCQTVLARVPDQPNAVLILGVIRTHQKHWDEAEFLFKKACSLYPDKAGGFVNLGKLYILRNRHEEAIEPLQTAVLLQPNIDAHKIPLIRSYYVKRFRSYDENARAAMILCLNTPALAHSVMTVTWLSLLMVTPALQDFLALLRSPDYETFRARVTPETLQPALADEFLLGGLRRFVVPHPDIERGLTFLRRWFLEQGTRDEKNLDTFLPFLCALGGYCFFSEYVFAVTPDELATAKDIGNSLPALALSSCYAPLHHRADAADIMTRVQNPGISPDFRDLVRIQIAEPLEEQKIRNDIPVLGMIRDEISQAVREQYEDNPYPRWATLGIAPVPPAVRALGRGKKVLVAGCGTGHEAVEMALVLPEAVITAVDLSRTSLSYGIRKAREMNISNISFYQSDILELGIQAGPFDLIVCSGVLHHMKDPIAGWETLTSLMAPGGLIRIALYSAIARQFIAQTRDYIARKNYPTTPDGIRSLRADIFARPADDETRRRLAHNPEFYAMSPCRDLLFHVQEHTFTLPQIKEIHEDLGLSLRRVEARLPRHIEGFKTMFPEPGAARNLDHWHEFEKLYTDTFAGMYILLFCRREDEEAVRTDWYDLTKRI